MQTSVPEKTGSIQEALGQARVLLRANPSLALEQAQEILKADPNEPRAHYVQG